MFCKYCGKEAEANDKFCKGCGAKLENTSNNVEKIDIVEEVKKEEAVNNIVVDNTNNSNSKNSEVKVEKLKGLRIAALVLGIISLVFFILNIILLPLEITGLVLAIVYVVKNKKFCAGVVLNAIALVLSIVIFLLGASALVSVANYVDKNPDEFGKKIENFFDEIDKQLDADIENNFNEASKQLQDAKEQIQKVKNEVKVYTDNKTSDKYATGYKYVGSEEFGYIKVPNNWVKFVDVESNDTIQYSYANTWITTIYATKSDMSLSNYANTVYSNFKDDGANFVTLRKEKITEKNYNAYKITCYYEDDNVYVRCWTFEDENGIKHYIAIEGPEKENDYYDLINTFVLSK